MGLFDLFRRRAAPDSNRNAMTSEELRDEYMRAFAQLKSDPRPLNALVKKHFERIVSEAPGWSVVPEAIRHDRAACSGYVNGLIFLAHKLRDLGHPALLNKLAGDPGDNPIAQWQVKLNEAQRLGKELKFAEAIDLAGNALIDHRQLMGPGADHMAAPTHGLLGHLCFDCGKMDLACGHYETALRSCEASGDAEGVGVYPLLLYQVHRYLGNGETAAGYVQRAAAQTEAEGKPALAKWYGRQAEVYRRGAPLLRMIARIGEEPYELGDLGPLRQNVETNFLFERNRPTIGLCEALTRRGGEFGSKNQFYEALAEFRAAAEADPFDPQPHYEEGHTLMNLERHAEAVACFDAVEARAPGWFNSRGDRWLAQEIAAGRAPHGAFVLLRFQDVGPEVMSFKQRLELVDRVLREAPDLAPLHLFRGRTLEALGRRPEAADACRAGLARAEEPDVRSRLLVQLHLVSDDGEEKVRVLREAAALRDTGSLMAATMAAVSLRSFA